MGGKNRPACLCWRDLTQAISEKAQGALRRNGRIKLAYRTGGGIARVDKGFLAGGPLALIERFKIGASHVDLAPHLDHRRRWQCTGCGSIQTQWNLPDGADVLGHILTQFTVAPCRGLHQHALLIPQAHGQAVELELGHVLDRRRCLGKHKFPAHPGIKIKRTRGFGVGLGADAEHRHSMPHTGECGQGRGAHALGGRIGADQFRVHRLDRLQGPKQAVVLGIGNGGRIQHVVAVRMLVQQMAQLGQLRQSSRCRRRIKQIRRLHGR